MNRSTLPGFSLIEIIIAIAIVALMATLVIPNLFSYLSGAQKKAATSALRTLKLSVEKFQIDTGQFPESLNDLVKPPADEEIARNYEGPYVQGKTALVDPWKRKYEYRRVTEGGEHPYELYSYGPNGKGAPKTEWISVWDL